MTFEELERRRQAYRRLCKAREFAVLAGDRIAVLTLADRCRFHRYRLQQAEKIHNRPGAIFMPARAPFATSDNPVNTAATTGDNPRG